MTRRILTVRPLLLALGAAVLLLVAALAGLALWPGGRDAVAGRAEPPRCTPDSPCLALVMDDLGRDLGAARRLVALPYELTFAVLPHAAETPASRRLFAERGAEILLHLPMEPEDASRESDEPVVLRRGAPIAAPAVECLGRVPEAVGVNNHMGSALSRADAPLEALLGVVRQRGLWFLDSRTAADSRICLVARRLGVPCLGRDVFLDDPPDAVTIRERLREALVVARRRGWAVLIGHPLPATIAALESDEMRRLGPFFVRLSRLVANAGHGP